MNVDVANAVTPGLMRRLVKEQLVRFDNTPLFPERIAKTLSCSLSEQEKELYDRVTEYVRQEMNRADRLSAEGEGIRGNRVGFALTILQRRLASSPEAIYQSLRRRRERLEKRLNQELQSVYNHNNLQITLLQDSPGLPEVNNENIEDWEDAPGEEQLVDQGRAEPPIYIKNPFGKEPDFAVTSVNYNLKELIARGEVIS